MKTVNPKDDANIVPRTTFKERFRFFSINARSIGSPSFAGVPFLPRQSYECTVSYIDIAQTQLGQAQKMKYLFVC
jgi:hypothetical protein